VVELTVGYDGAPPMFGVQLLEFRDDKVTRERIYVMEGWDAPEWRAAWRSATLRNRQSTGDCGALARRRILRACSYRPSYALCSCARSNFFISRNASVTRAI
jgi:hypothetical protein